MKIATLTLNPALDRTMSFASPFQTGELNRAFATSVVPGGKGMNVSLVLSLLARAAGVPDPSVSYCFLGGDEGRAVARFFEEENLHYRAVETRAPSRVNIKCIDSDGCCTEANEAGGPIEAAEFAQLFHTLVHDASAGCFDLLVLGGSIPQGVEKSVYKSISVEMKRHGIRVVLDCDGGALRAAMADADAAPALIKPNLYELSGYIGQDFSSIGQRGVSAATAPALLSEVAAACVEIYVDKSTEVLCTLGSAGSLYTGAEGTFYTEAPTGVEVRGFAGAGDTFLAAYLWNKYVEKRGITETLTRASAAAAAKVACAGAAFPRTAVEMEREMPRIRCVQMAPPPGS